MRYKVNMKKIVPMMASLITKVVLPPQRAENFAHFRTFEPANTSANQRDWCFLL